MKTLLTLLLALLFCGCAKDGKEISASDNSNFEIMKLFTTDSITVYRFLDSGHYHYFTKYSTYQTLSCGKNCSYDEQIDSK